MITPPPARDAVVRLLAQLGWREECRFRELVLYEHRGYDDAQCALPPEDAPDYVEACGLLVRRLVAVHGYGAVHRAAAEQRVGLDACLHVIMVRTFEESCRRA